MKSLSRLLNVLIVILVTLSISLQSFQPASAEPAGTVPQDGGVVRTGYNRETGKVNFIGADPARPITVRGAQTPGLAPGDRARALLAPYAGQFGIKDIHQELTQKSSSQQAGRQVTHYQQSYRGIPVMGGELVVNATSGGGLLSINGEISPDLNIVTKPSISAGQARAAALQSVAKGYQLDVSQLETSQPALWIYDSRLLEPDGQPALLVWRMDVRAKDPLVPVNELVLVDALRGGIRLHFSQIDHAGAAPADSADVTEPLPGKGVVSESGNPANPYTGVTWYVATSGNDTNDCLTPLTPCATLNTALSKIADGDVINIAIGTYVNTDYPNYLIDKAVTLSGGWNSTFSTQNGMTTLDGDGGTVFSITSNATLERLKIQNGWLGIHIASSTANVTLRQSFLTRHRLYGISNSGTLRIENSTLSGNSGLFFLTAIQNSSTGILTIVNSTITNNSAPNSPSAGGIRNNGGIITIQNSILWGNNQNNCYIVGGTFSSLGNNIIGTSSMCNISLLGSDSSSNPNITSLITGTVDGDYHALQSGSPAIDTANATACPSVDQRGAPRPYGSGCDIGAYEYDSVPPAVDPLVATNIYLYAGSLQFAGVSTAFSTSLQASVKDQYGYSFSGAIVNFTAPANGASGTFSDSGTNTTTATSNASGIATAAAFIANNTVGSYTVDATASGVTGSTGFQLENIILAPTTMLLYGGLQTTQINTTFADPLKVMVRDQLEHYSVGVTVTFTAPASGPSGTFSDSGTYTTTAITGADGIATAAAFTANGLDGDYVIAASVPEIASPANFPMNNWATHNWYVSNTGNDSNNCFTPATPCATIDAPLNKPVFRAGEVIYVETGTYIGGSSFVVNVLKSVSILGGWNSDFTAQTGYSTIDADSAHSGISFSSLALTTSLDRFIISNSTSYGLYANNTTLDVTNTIIQNGTGVGAQISFANATLTNVSVHNNAGKGIAIHSGWAIYNIAIADSAIYNNGDTGLYNDQGNVTVKNSTISGNVSSGQGGGIYTYTSLTAKQLSLNNVTISGNSANQGGGIYHGNGPVILKNTLISGNTAVTYPDCRLSATSQGYNLIGNNSGCTFTPTTGDQTNVSLFILPLADYGGPTLTHALLKNSLAVNAGNPAAPGSGGSACESTDQRGIPRPAGSACDIGAFEYSGPGTTPAYLYFYQGSPQYILANGTAAFNFQTVVLDANGSAVPGATVTFTAPASGPSGTFSNTGTNVTTALADANGIATIASNFTANALLGHYEVQATVDGVASSVIFDVTNAVSVAIPISTYTMNYSTDPNSLPGTFVCNQTQPICSGGGDPDADRAQQYAIDTYVFYLDRHNRDSIDNAGMAIVSSVHFGLNYANAAWTGDQVVYGEGYPNADDVVAHELTHGVTQYESGLFYYYQSGAINESFSDIWGEIYDQSNGLANDTPGVEWLIGENLPGGALRSMSNPPAYGDPDAVDSPNYYTLGDDNGGVHQNSGVNNKAAYLLLEDTAGDNTFNGKTVTPLGADKTLAIYYEAQTNLLTSGADYADLYNVLYQACLNVVGGPDGVVLADCQEVRDATDAVHMNAQPIANFNTDAPLCSAGLAAQNIFFDGLEAGTGNWVFSNGAQTRWQLGSPYGPYAHSGQNFLYANDYPQILGSPTNATATLNAITLPANAYLHFYHAYDFEQYPGYNFDGGVIEYSINNGTTWIDAGSLINSNGYKGLIYNGQYANNPLRGRNAFVGASHGYISTRLNLSSLAGKSVKFRWRMGLDDSGFMWGWWLDDTRVYTCSMPTISGNTGVAGATLSYTDGTAKTATADKYGNYSFGVSSGWNGTVTPSKTCYIFTPPNRSYSNVTDNQAAQNYTYTLDPAPACPDIEASVGKISQGLYDLPSEITSKQAYTGLLNGPVRVLDTSGAPLFTSQVVTSGESYNELLGFPADQLHTEYWFPWYDHGYSNVPGSTMRTWFAIGNPHDTLTADVDVYIGGVFKANYDIAPGGQATPRWIGLQDGPVRIVSTNGVDIFASQRVFTAPDNSFNESMGYPADQFVTEYWFPWYDSVYMNSSLMIGNTSSSTPANVDVYIGGVFKGSYVIGFNDTLIQSYPSLVNGPVRVVSTNGVNIVVSQRVRSGPKNSYNEVMGYPNNQFHTEYWFPWYDHGYGAVGGSNMRTWLAIGNPHASLTADVDVYIGGVFKGNYDIPAGGQATPRWTGLQAGPVRIVSINGVDIFASQRVFTVPNSVFNEMLGFPADQLTSEYWFPWYDSINMGTSVFLSKP